MKPSVYVHARYGDDPASSVQFVVLDVGRHGKIAELQLPPRKAHAAVEEVDQLRLDLRELLRKSQFKDMVASGEIRLEEGTRIAEVVIEIQRAVESPDGISPVDRIQWEVSHR